MEGCCLGLIFRPTQPQAQALQGPQCWSVCGVSAKGWAWGPKISGTLLERGMTGTWGHRQSDSPRPGVQDSYLWDKY